MFSVILVDDEHWALLGLRNSFEWEKYGFEIIAQTTNPIEAFDLIVELKPDAVFTDINMKAMNGLNIISECRKRGFQTDFVVVSGYSDFSYAQDAVKYGAFYYMLKPIDMTEGEAVLDKLKNHLEHKHELSKKLADIDIDTVLQDKSSLVNYLDKNGLKEDSGIYQVIVANGTLKPEEFIKKNNSEHITLMLGSNKYAFFIKVDEEINEENVRRYIGINHIGFSGIGLSSPCTDRQLLLEKFNEADSAAYGSFFLSPSIVHFYNRKSTNIVKEILDNFSEILDNNNDLKRSEFFDGLTTVFYNNKMGIQEVALLYNQMVAYLNYRLLGTMSFTNLEFLQYEQIARKFKNFSELCNYIKDIVPENFKNKRTILSETEAQFEKLLEYVSHNYNIDIYLSDLSDLFYLNSTYISELFKKFTSKTFSQYMTDLRINKAAQLLEDTNDSIEAISQQVGYNDYFYFNRIFKKHFNLTPKQYRKEMRR